MITGPAELHVVHLAQAIGGDAEPVRVVTEGFFGDDDDRVVLADGVVDRVRRSWRFRRRAQRRAQLFGLRGRHRLRASRRTVGLRDGFVVLIAFTLGFFRRDSARAELPRPPPPFAGGFTAGAGVDFGGAPSRRDSRRARAAASIAAVGGGTGRRARDGRRHRFDPARRARASALRRCSCGFLSSLSFRICASESPTRFEISEIESPRRTT